MLIIISKYNFHLIKFHDTHHPESLIPPLMGELSGSDPRLKHKMYYGADSPVKININQVFLRKTFEN